MTWNGAGALYCVKHGQWKGLSGCAACKRVCVCGHESTAHKESVGCMVWLTPGVAVCGCKKLEVQRGSR